MKRHSRSVALLLAATVLGCPESEKPRTPVARVDGHALTLEEISSSFDSLRGVSEAQIHAFVQRWITDELLYREAVRRGLDQQPSLATRLDDIRRQLVINALLDQEVYHATSAERSPEEIQQYYEEHRNEFVLTSDVVLVSYALFTDRDAANAFRTAILRGMPWTQALRLTPDQTTFRAAMISSVDSSYFTRQTLFPVELWRTATGIGTNSPSFPVRTEEGYYVLIVWKLARQGQQAELAYVEKEIRSRLAIERRRRLYDALLENLRAKYSVEVLVTPGTQDTSSLTPEEEEMR